MHQRDQRQRVNQTLCRRDPATQAG